MLYRRTTPTFLAKYLLDILKFTKFLILNAVEPEKQFPLTSLTLCLAPGQQGIKGLTRRYSSFTSLYKIWKTAKTTVKIIIVQEKTFLPQRLQNGILSLHEGDLRIIESHIKARWHKTHNSQFSLLFTAVGETVFLLQKDGS